MCVRHQRVMSQREPAGETRIQILDLFGTLGRSNTIRTRRGWVVMINIPCSQVGPLRSNRLLLRVNNSLLYPRLALPDISVLRPETRFPCSLVSFFRVEPVHRVFSFVLPLI